MSASLVGSEMCIRDSGTLVSSRVGPPVSSGFVFDSDHFAVGALVGAMACLLYTSDAADDM
eukprot:10249344-Alexandrium_andersonii.AAC.1